MKKLFSAIAICCVFISCSKKDDPAPSTSSTTLTANSTPQFSVSLNGTSMSMVSNGSTIEGVNGADKSLATFPNNSTAIYSSYVGNTTTNVGFEIARGQMVFMGNFPSDADFLNFFPSGSYSYMNGAMGGVVVRYFDSSGTIWSTDNGTGDQTGSTFTIDERNGATLGDYHVRFKASFNCKLYDTSGNTKTVTNGVFVGSFANI